MMLQAHPAAEMFPLMDGDELDALAADIREHGLREPIVLTNGLILDGRNRYHACEKLGIQPTTIEWDRNGTPEAFVVSMNLHRRHLSASQRAMIAARLPLLKRGPVAPQKADRQNCRPPLSQSEAAAILNVGEVAVRDAVRVLAGGSPEEIAKVDRGSASVFTTAKRIRVRSKAQTPSDTNERRIQKQQMNGKIWTDFRAALDGMQSLPQPSDAAKIITKQARRLKFPLKDRVMKAQQWLRELGEHIND